VSQAISLLGASEIRSLADELDIKPSKSLGQNFVIDSNVCRKIVRLAQVTSGDTVVEIGPGLGSLTLAIMQTGAAVIAVELDKRLADRLSNTASEHGAQGGLTVINADALEIAELPRSPTKLVANLPYNVSVPVLLNFLERFPSISSGIVMVQREVAERLAARPGSKSYGVPSAKASWWCDLELSDDVSRSIFWPVPNVDSALVSFSRHKDLGDEAHRRATFDLVDRAFGQRRKMLRSALASRFGSSVAAQVALEAAGIDPTARGESLDIKDFARLASATK
jgi:16S rRNA (adenine1518-N6/adenine1519-N6)-dimethyltransferase